MTNDVGDLCIMPIVQMIIAELASRFEIVTQLRWSSVSVIGELGKERLLAVTFFLREISSCGKVHSN